MRCLFVFQGRKKVKADVGSLGSFGAAVKEFDPDAEKDTFDFFGETFTVEGVIPPMVVLKLGAALTGSLRQVEFNGVVYVALRSALSKPGAKDGDPADESQFERFCGLATAKKCDDDSLAQLVWTLVATQAGKDIESRPTSPPGSPATSESSSSSASVSPDSLVFRPVDEILNG